MKLKWANKIVNEKIDIDKILVVTFTKAAASEMKARVLDAIYKKIEENPDDRHLRKTTKSPFKSKHLHNRFILLRCCKK